MESHYYLVLPLLFWLTRGLSVRRTGQILFLVLFLVPLVIRQLTWPANVYVLPDASTALYAETWWKFARFPCQLDYFAWGILFASVFVSLKSEGLDKLRALSLFGYAGMGLMAVTLVYYGLWTQQFHIGANHTRWSVAIEHLLPAVAVMLMLFFIFDRQSLGARILSMGWLRFVGIISYEWFLFHGPVVGWFQDHYPGQAHGNLLAYAWKTLFPLALTFGFAVLVYRYFSLPIMHRVRDRLKSGPN